MVHTLVGGFRSYIATLIFLYVPLLGVSFLLFHMTFDPRHNFFDRDYGIVGERLVEMFNFKFILEGFYEHLLVGIDHFNGDFIESLQVLSQ